MRLSRLTLVVTCAATLLLAAESPAVAQRPGDPSNISVQQFNPALLEAPTITLAASSLFGADLGANDGSSTLFQVDAANGAIAVRGETGVLSVTDLAFSPDGRLFAITFTQFLELNPRTGAPRIIGSVPGVSGLNALTVSPLGIVYAATTSGQFLRVDSATGVATVIGSYGSGLASSGDLAFDRDGVLYATATNFSTNNVLVSIDIATGRATVIGSIGFPDVFGLAFGPDDVLYGVAYGGGFSTPVLIQVDKATGVGTAIGSLPTQNGMGGLTTRVIKSSVEGPLRQTGIENPTCENSLDPRVWTFCQHQTGGHSPGGGVQDSDDTYAWDVNLLNNGDAGRPVYAAAVGKVVKFAGTIPTLGNISGAVLIEHSWGGASCDTNPENCWWSGYLHMQNIQVHEGQLVGPWTLLGFVGNVSPSPIPDHLHFVAYEGANLPGQLRSFDAVITPRHARVRHDFDGDGISDFSVYRPANGVWYVLESFTNFRGYVSNQWGISTDSPMSGDYDGDGKSDIAVWRRSTGVWYVIRSSDGTRISKQWGAGLAPYNDVPVPGDYDGDSRTDFAVWRPSTGVWYVIRSSDGITESRQWGAGYAPYNDVPVPGDYDGDGKTDIAVWRASTGVWYVRRSSDGITESRQWGAGYAPYNDVPVPGDYDGDGKTDIAVWRASTGVWYVLKSSDLALLSKQWGAITDTPVLGPTLAQFEGEYAGGFTVIGCTELASSACSAVEFVSSPQDDPPSVLRVDDPPLPLEGTSSRN